MTPVPSEDLGIDNEVDLIEIRKRIRNAAAELGFGVTDVTRIVTASSELARNVYLYAQRGRVRMVGVQVGGRQGLELCFIDEGPGIEDLDQAMRPGFSTSRGLGLGLPGVRRLMDEMEIETVVGRGTTITVRKWLGR